VTGAAASPVDLAPGPLGVAFVLLVGAMWALVVAGVRSAARGAGWSGRAPVVAALGLAGWLGLFAAAGVSGFFADFAAWPPRFAILLVPMLVVVIALARSRTLTPLLAATPPARLVYAQSFRIAVELVLWALVVAGVAPDIMSFTGRNFDGVVGLSAPVVAHACCREDRWRDGWPRTVALWWNVVGIAVLANTVIHAQLAAPTPLQVFHTVPPNTFIAFMPYVWLPTFLVPLAWSLHVLSIRQLLAGSRRPLG
jgi:MFS family permease